MNVPDDLIRAKLNFNQAIKEAVEKPDSKYLQRRVRQCENLVKAIEKRERENRNVASDIVGRGGGSSGGGGAGAESKARKRAGSKAGSQAKKKGK